MSCLVCFATPNLLKSKSATIKTKKWVNPITGFTHFLYFIATTENPEGTGLFFYVWSGIFSSSDKI